jgi:hypothetical protein
MMARFVDTVGSGVRIGVGSGVGARVGWTVGAADGSTDGSTDGETDGETDGSTDADGVASGLVLGAIVAEADPLGSGLPRIAADADAAGVSVASGVDAGVAVGRGVGGVADGVSVGRGVGRVITTTASPPDASVPTTTAWFPTGDCEIDFGRMDRSTCLESRSATGSQSGWPSVVQTSSMLVEL